MTPNEAINVAIPVAVCVMMFALGIGTTKEDFQNALRTRTPFLIGLMLQFLLVRDFNLIFLSHLFPTYLVFYNRVADFI